MRNRTIPTALLLCLLFACLPRTAAAQTSSQTPELFTYDELVQLYEQKDLPEPLQNRLNLLLTTPFVSNAAAAKGVRPLMPNSPKLGKFLRVVEWNIERGLEYDAIKSAFGDPQAYGKLLDSARFPRGSDKRKRVLNQVALMKQADVILLNEVDRGMKRTEYRNVASDLASALGMNYAYGVEFVEVDPIALGRETFAELSEDDQKELGEEIKVDPARYKGLHGNAILSRFPLENVRLRPFTYQAHDWYTDEIKSVSPVEKGKRKAADLILEEKIRREVRRGGRTVLTAEIADAQLPGGRVTIVNTHLEDKTKPEGRRKQLEELLAQLKDCKTPVVFAGDLNTSTDDGTPTSIRRELKHRLGSKSFWLKQGLSILAGIKLPSLAVGSINTYRKQSDPTVRSIPLVAKNAEAEFFERLKGFRFDDGGAFDFRGDRQRSVDNRSAVLANSNQRGEKGFVTTFEVERTIAFVGKFKLDWFFVKPPALTDPEDTNQPYLFAPHFGRTLKILNESIEDRISDHAPLMIDLPLAEPRM
ncbi:MAG: endonuclease/exonuclease/phosphatase family protein [Pyrinomonadaceae bacterium]